MEKIIYSIIIFIAGNVGCFIHAVTRGAEGIRLKREMIISNFLIIALIILYLTGVLWH